VTTFVHLNLHTEFSLVDSTVRVPKLLQAVAADGMPAVAMTDQSNLFAMVKFYRAALKNGIKPIIGAEIWLQHAPEEEPSKLVLLCKDIDGFRCLSKLISRAYVDGQVKGVPVVQRDWLDIPDIDRLIALSGAREGAVGRALLADRTDDARAVARQLATRFAGDFYLELQRTGRPGDERQLRRAVRLAAEMQIPVVASNDVRFLAADDFEAHEARVCINQGHSLDDQSRPRDFSAEQYLRSPEEMAELFADLPEALVNATNIATRCNLALELGNPQLPTYDVPAGMSEADYLEQASVSGLAARLGLAPDAGTQAMPEAYRQRLSMELDVIRGMGFPGYFLIVADFIRWARANGVPVGPGRGSGAGSLVAWALAITDLDPIEHDLLFERFLNPERVSMPDFDVDFCMEGRDRVIDYVAERYGRERVSQIITFGTMAAKAVVRDAGRVLGQPYGFVDRVAKLMPFESA
jgi:DNA polymerase-3 subunit alpha